METTVIIDLDLDVRKFAESIKDSEKEFIFYLRLDSKGYLTGVMGGNWNKLPIMLANHIKEKPLMYAILMKALLIYRNSINTPIEKKKNIFKRIFGIK